jgi:hypothetical protein
MIYWIILAVLAILLFIFLKARHTQHRILVVLLMLLLIFFYTTFSSVVKENEIDIKTFDGVTLAGRLYFSWLTHIFDNSKTIVGDVVKMDWQGNASVGG